MFSSNNSEKLSSPSLGNGEAMYLFSDVDSSGHFTKLWCENGCLSSWTVYTRRFMVLIDLYRGLGFRV